MSGEEKQPSSLYTEAVAGARVARIKFPGDQLFKKIDLCGDIMH